LVSFQNFLRSMINERARMKAYSFFSLILMVVFLAVGVIFFLIPAKVLIFFNSLSGFFGLPLIPVHEPGFYLVLAVSYMYLVAVIAYCMHRHPEAPIFPFLLAHGKIASSILSLGLALLFEPYLIFWVNCLADGVIGFGAYYFYRRLKNKNS